MNAEAFIVFFYSIAKIPGPKLARGHALSLACSLMLHVVSSLYFKANLTSGWEGRFFFSGLRKCMLITLCFHRQTFDCLTISAKHEDA